MGGSRQTIRIAGAWVLVLATVTTVARAQTPRGREPDTFIQQQQQVTRDIWERAEQEAPVARRVGFEYGGWYSFHLFLWDDGINSSRTYRRNDLRVWSRLTLDGGAHEFYARGLLSYLDFNSGDSYGGKDNDWEGMNLERGYYEFNLARALKTYRNQTLDSNFRLKVGRDLVKLGTGYALWTPMDHVRVVANLHDFEITGLVGQSVKSTPDFDRSRPITESDRAFFAAQVRYLGIRQHEPFAYVLWQRDHNQDTFWALGREFDYDSFYVGLGSQGELVRNLWYSTEWVYESGRGHNGRRVCTDSVIKAWAFDAQLEYLFDTPMEPRASLEYMFASGDPDRVGSPTDSAGGNRLRDPVDRGFNGFGFRDTGLSFAPQLGNVHIWRAGTSFCPVKDKPLLYRLELGTNWFLYHKSRREAAVSDPTADQQSGYLGWEMDYFANWEITPDLMWTTRYGLFFPGDAFSDRTTRTYFLVGMTWSF
jgi:hypothetical protein